MLTGLDRIMRAGIPKFCFTKKMVHESRFLLVDTGFLKVASLMVRNVRLSWKAIVTVPLSPS